ncbi:hypothetical protein CO669_25490 [Bradyrhizobium sp. Y36]|uniref:hypothetical protein n=1 Tax=Bradyrhizobium sp. Y36 TaxID=2035447 RepID=UPI000BEAD8A4|nr:hypothetical protein [Bradyrhizobium sp. Y36]PDT87517.1 hypothetical protein CO669_25490 [Bradyrhizobium sp. Y36]
MRMPLLILIPLLAGSAAPAAAEALRLPPAERPKPGTTVPLKGEAGKARAGSCASYGPRFVMVEGTGTCVKVGGSISIDTTVRR